MTNADCWWKASNIHPVLGSVWNPEYHKALVEQLGFRAVCRSFGYLLPLHRLDVPERLKRIVERVVRTGNFKLRPIDMSCLEEELKIVREIYNSTLDRNWGFIPISMDDLLASAEDMKAFADPEMIVIAEINGENAGVALDAAELQRNPCAHKENATPTQIAAYFMADEDSSDQLRTPGGSWNFSALP